MLTLTKLDDKLKRLSQKSMYVGRQSVPPRGSGWVRSFSLCILRVLCVSEVESFGTINHRATEIHRGYTEKSFAPTRYREVVLTATHYD